MMKSRYSLTIDAVKYMRFLVKTKLRDEPNTVVCLGWGRWEDSHMQIMPGFYPEPNYPNSPPVYNFDGLLVSFAFPINTVGIPLESVITLRDNQLVFLDNDISINLKVIEGLLIRE